MWSEPTTRESELEQMKMSLTLNNTTHSVESDLPWPDVGEVITQFKGLLVGAGFHPELVDRQFNTEDGWFDCQEETTDRVEKYQDDMYRQAHQQLS